MSSATDLVRSSLNELILGKVCRCHDTAVDHEGMTVDKVGVVADEEQSRFWVTAAATRPRIIKYLTDETLWLPAHHDSSKIKHNVQKYLWFLISNETALPCHAKLTEKCLESASNFTAAVEAPQGESVDENNRKTP